MNKRNRNNDGFTLAELLMAVAIVMILAALAVPSIISTQNNMMMTELDNAATSIANATQNRMTSMKVSGTWIPLLDKINYDDQPAHEFPIDEDVDEDDIFYLTAEQAKDNGILPANSIEQNVYEGDFVIEYSRSTATVCGVFFSDGRSGVFSSENNDPDDTPAKDYYLDDSFASVSREQDNRLEANPMVGYYWGTPADATNTIILENPTIWIDEEESYLCIQNPNLSDASLDTSLQATVTLLNEDESRSEYDFVLAGLKVDSGDLTSFELTTTKKLNNGESGITIDPVNNELERDVVKVISRDGSAFSELDVFVIDLNRLLQIIEGSSIEFWESPVSPFQPESPIRIDVSISTVKPAEPTSASALAKWPRALERLTILVTDPYINDPDIIEIDPDVVVTKAAEGSYVAPKVEPTDENGAEPVVFPSSYKEYEVCPIETAGSLQAENAEEARQVYSGTSIRLSEKAHLKATVGSYKTLGNIEHQYQIHEIYLNKVKIGYLKNSVWRWTPLGLKYAAAFKEGPVEGKPTGGETIDEVSNTPVTSVRINPSEFASIEATLTDDEKNALNLAAGEGYIVHVRTTPRFSEVKEYVKSNMDALSTYSREVDVISARSNGGDMAEAESRQHFENEFGASSAVASWTFLQKDAESDIAGFPSGLRYYYSGTPAVGFDGEKTMSEENKKIENAALWFHSLKNTTFTEEPQATVHDPQESGDTALIEAGSYNMKTEEGSSADFELSHMQDALFTRVLFYFDTNNNRMGSQYVPHDVSLNAEVEAGQTKSFVYWRTKSTYSPMPQGKWLACKGQHKVGTGFDSVHGERKLRWGQVDLIATEAQIGLVYYEQYNKGTSDGYYGYSDARLTTGPDIDIGISGNDKAISYWNYHVAVPTFMIESGSVPELYRNGDRTPLDNAEIVIEDKDGISYTLFYLPDSVVRGNSNTEEYFTFKDIKYGDYNARYHLNTNFAKAVHTQKSEANKWGKLPHQNGTPYIVRHISQFVGCLGGTRDSYMNKYFKQEHNIAFDSTISAPSYSNVNFTGHYDGGNNEIQGYKPGIQGSDSLIVGLFYQTNNATISNVLMTDVQSNTWQYKLSGYLGKTYYVKFGYFAGEARNTTFDNCVVVGKKGTQITGNDYDVYITYEATNGLQSIYVRPCLGGIVGETQNGCVLKDCFVSDLKIRGTRKAAGILTTRYMVGGLVGRTSSATTISSVDRSVLVQNSTISIDINRNNNESFSGAIVGCAASNSTINWDNSKTRHLSVYNQVEKEYFKENEYLGGVFSD